MIKILAIHNTGMTCKDYHKKLITKYPILAKHPDVWKIDVIKMGTKLKAKHKGKIYDSLYYDEPTCELTDVTKYVVALGHPQIIPVNLDKELLRERRAKEQKPKKNVTFIKSPVKEKGR